MATGCGAHLKRGASSKVMRQPRVSVVRCEGYESEVLSASIARSLSLIGGLEQYVRRGDHVFVKVNHLSPPSPPEKAIVTHPLFVRSVLEQVLELTSQVSLGDDVQADGDPFALSGYRQLCGDLGATLVNLRQRGFAEVHCRGKILDRILIAREVLEADVLINLPKLKTHSLTTLTGAVKNLYGVIPSGMRSGYHGQYSRPDQFNQVLVDIYAAAAPALHIMDAVVGMEAEGPAAGNPRNTGLIIAGGDGVAVDAVAATLIGLNPLDVGTTQAADSRSVGVGDLAAIAVVGDPIEEVRPEPFVLPSTTPVRYLSRIPPCIARLFTSQLSVRPTVDLRQCVGCGACASICPVEAAVVEEGKARIRSGKCIRCMCCHEVCRYGAITLRRSLRGRALYKALQALRRLFTRS